MISLHTKKFQQIKPDLDDFLSRMLEDDCQPMTSFVIYSQTALPPEAAPMEASASAPAPRPMAVGRAMTCESTSIDAFLEQKEETFSTMLLRLIDEKDLKDSDVYKRANIDRRLFSKIRGDEDYVPSKKTAIAFCLALQLSLDEAEELLSKAGYALSTSTRFDLIIIYLINHQEFNINFANIVLDEYGEGTLSK